MTFPRTAVLSPAQTEALRAAQDLAGRRKSVARMRITEVLRRARCDVRTYDAAVESVALHARVVIHFHPDRICKTGTPVVEGLLLDGIFRNQFETGLSAGSLSAFSGGARNQWERRLFGGAYHRNDAPAERPKYGALELVRFGDGPIPRFGSCYLVLRPHVASRTSFTFMGSEDPRANERIGLVTNMHCVMAELLAEVEAGGITNPPWPPFRAPTLGVENLTVTRLLDLLMSELPRSRPDPANAMIGRVLDSQIEAQVHGAVDLREDVELLVADPAFAAADIGVTLRALAAKYDIGLRWQPGFRLSVTDVPDDFRGPAMPRLARRIVRDGETLDAVAIGKAEASYRTNPDDWADYGEGTDVLQHLKQLWHVLVHFGSPIQV